jgi:hypothetical protein
MKNLIKEDNMKKILLAALVTMLIATTAFAAITVAISSGLKSSSSVVINKPGYLIGSRFFTTGADDGSLICYDNATSASGTIVEKLTTITGDNFGGSNNVIPVKFNSGLYCAVTGTGGAFIIYYSLGE